jgi:hypothetical protein
MGVGLRWIDVETDVTIPENILFFKIKDAKIHDSQKLRRLDNITIFHEGRGYNPIMGKRP